MRPARASALLATLALSTAAGAALSPPPQVRVATATAIAAPCLSIETGAVTVSLPMDALGRAVAARPPLAQDGAGSRPWRDERERLALIRGDRAAALLAAPRLQGRDLHGCRRTALRDVSKDAQYVIGAMIEAGTAAVSRTGEPGLVDDMLVARPNPEPGRGPMGAALYRLHEGERPFLMLVEWIV
ncbi:hypothetical protein [Luteimonas sp. FCS-9]|uniref:hypothetical protein n=1 Tax=Luteimonas sp. FCS-9 TaxID=1547516 RepID=UPI00063E7358|nr:hypothetical protein [Luteimonas sp. FCS-9]KLJ01060.1 hypothetical protein WQ56_07480 [Luteimonas sp. FCS-9]